MAWDELKTDLEKKQVVRMQDRDVQINPNIEEKFVDLDNLAIKKGLKILVFGPPGCGKTHFCLTAPEKVMVVDTEMGVRALKPLFKNKKIKIQEVYIDNPQTYRFDAIRSLDTIDEAIFSVRHHNPQPETFVIDSATSWWQWLQEWLRFEIETAGGRINMKGVPMDRRDWGKANTRHLEAVMALLNMNSNVIITAQSDPLFDSQGNLLPIDTFAFDDVKIWKNLPRFVDLAFRMGMRMDNGIMKRYMTCIKSRLPIVSDSDITDMTNTKSNITTGQILGSVLAGKTHSMVGRTFENPTFDSVKDEVEKWLK